MTDIAVSEWTEQELKGRLKCYCDCHQYPGTYPTTIERPCRFCGHINELGYYPWGSSRFGWVEYYIFDRRRVLGKL